MSKPQIDWDRVAQVIRRCVTRGGSLERADRMMIEAAIKQDEEKYSALHSQIKKEEGDYLRGF